MPEKILLRQEKGGAEVVVYDNVSAPEIFADGAHGVLIAGGANGGQTIKFNLTSREFPSSDAASGSEERRVVARMVMGLADFESFVEFLNRNLDQYRRDVGTGAGPIGSGSSPAIQKPKARTRKPS